VDLDAWDWKPWSFHKCFIRDFLFSPVSPPHHNTHCPSLLSTPIDPGYFDGLSATSRPKPTFGVAINYFNFGLKKNLAEFFFPQ
jgi:hypothetical protein